MDKWIVDDLIFVKDPAGYYVPETTLCVEGTPDLVSRFSKEGAYTLVEKEGTVYKVLAVCKRDDFDTAGLLSKRADTLQNGEFWMFSKFPDLGGLDFV